jgi:putative Holliday junction resolvase
MKRTLGLDVGDKTVGLALSDGLGITAQGLDTLARKNIETDLAAIASLCAEHEVERLVVGLPLNMDGSEGPRAELTRRFGDKLAARTGLPAEYWDERLTTAEAERVLISADVSRQQRKKVIDKLAAQVILQSWLDAHAAPPSEPEDDP